MPEGQTPNDNQLLSFDQIIVAINNLASKLDEMITAQKECCGKGSGGGGCGGCGGGNGQTTDDPPTGGQNPVEPGNPVGAGGGGLPDNWTGTQAEYDAWKCKAANFVYYAVYNSLVYLGGLSTAAATIGAGAAFGSWLLSSISAGTIALAFAGGAISLALLPGWVLGLIVAAIAGIAALAGASVMIVFAWIANELDTIKEDVVCSLYNAQDVDEARQALIDHLTDVVTNFAIDPPYDTFEGIIRTGCQTVIDNLVSNQLINPLFQKTITVEMWEEDDIPCTDCAETGSYTVALGTETTENPSNPIDIDPAFIGVESCLEVMINFHQAVSITEIGFGGGSEDQNFDSCGAFNRFWYYSSEDQVDLIFSSNGFPHQNVIPTGVRSVYIRWEGHDIAGNWEPGFVTVFYSIDE